MRLTTANVLRFGDIAPILAGNGYFPVPIVQGTKRPVMEGWQNYAFAGGTEYAECYTGILTGHGCIALDMDCIDVQMAESIDKLAQQCLGKAPTRVGNWPKRLRLYRFDGEFKKQSLSLGEHGKIELMGTGQQIVAYAVHPDTQAPFEWTTTADPTNTHCSDLTTIERRHIDAFMQAVQAAYPQVTFRESKTADGMSRHADMPADERWAMHITHILEGSDLHDSIAALAAGWIRSGMPAGAVVQSLRAIVGQSAARTADEARWLDRYNDISRAVSTAETAFPPAATLTAPVPEALVLTLAELNEKAQAISWAVKGLIPESSLGMFFGASGTFKSFIALDYSLHRAWGLDWIGRKTKQATQIYLAAEGGAGVMRRILAWHLARGLDWKKCPMRVVAVPLVLRTQARTLATAIRAAGVAPGDIIVDTLAQTYDGDENSASEMSSWLRVVGSDLRDVFGATVTVVHHAGHSATERPRGSSAILANCDYLYGVMRDEAQMLATMECVKQKDGDQPEPIIFELVRSVLGRDGDGDEISSLVARHADSAAAVLESALKNRDGGLRRLIEAIDTGRPEKEVRQAFYAAMPDSSSEARRQAFHRSLRMGQQSGCVAVTGDWFNVAVQQRKENLA